jgi:hypothetical protein
MVKIITLPPLDDHRDEPPPRVIRTAEDAARSYDHCVEAYWRGEENGCAFCDAFARYWRPVVTRVEGLPEAESPLGAGGRGLLWREGDGIIVGEVRGSKCGYQFPAGVTLPEPELHRRSMRGATPNASLCRAP